MSCHICGQEAIDRCYTCGQLFCGEHGRVNCIRCETGIAPADNRADRISAGRLRDEKTGRVAWWRAQEAEDFEPPSCHICQGLARRVCRNCQQHYCAEHAGPSYLCQTCGRSSLLGIWCLLGGLAIMGGIVLSGFVVETLGPEQSRFLGKVALLIFVSVGGYVLMSFSCMKLFRKADKPGWLGFVPILNLVLLLELAGKPVWWLGLYFVFHLLSSLAGLALPNVFFFLFVLLVLSSPLIALQIIVGTGLARNFGKTQEFGIGLGLLPIVFLPMLAFSDAAYVAGAEVHHGEGR